MTESNNFASTKMYTPYQNGPIPYNQPPVVTGSAETADRQQIYRESIDQEELQDEEKRKKRIDRQMERADQDVVSRGNGGSNGAIYHINTTHNPLCCCMCARACESCLCGLEIIRCCESLCGKPLKGC